MKRLTFIFAMILSSQINSQVDTIRSIKLDSLIWNKISEYRKSIGVKPLKVFKTGKLRDYSTATVNRHISIQSVKHSHQQTEWYNAECLYRYQADQGKSFDESYKQIILGDFDWIAKRCVDGWISSDSHRAAISNPKNTIVSISTIIIIKKTLDERYFMDFIAVYHAVSNDPEECSQCYINMK